MELPRLSAGRHIFLALPLVVLLGCGSHPGPSTPASQYLNLNGNWEALGLPSPPVVGLTTPIAAFMGALQSTNGIVTGTLRAFDASNFLNPCVLFTQDLAATGTLTPAGNLVLTVPISNGTATLTATLSTNLQTFTQGTWHITGGACAMPSTPMAITQYAPVTGTYTGTLTTYGTATTTAITAVLTQSTIPDADGRFPLTGTITAPGICSGTFPLIPEVVSGNGIYSTNAGALAPASELTGAFLPDASAFQTAVVNIYGTLGLNCPAATFSGPLTRQ
jgi:hypothetical protein